MVGVYWLICMSMIRDHLFAWSLSLSVHECTADNLLLTAAYQHKIHCMALFERAILFLHLGKEYAMWEGRKCTMEILYD